jgi:hypothetical protein
MSDIKAKRAPRESVQIEGLEPSAAEPVPSPPPASLSTPAPAPMTVAAARPAAGADDVFGYGQEAWAAVAEAQAAAARGFEALVGEINTLTRSEIAAVADSAAAMLGVKTFAEAVEVNLGYARRSFDALIGSSAKLSEIGVRAAADASRPILTRLGSGLKPTHFG